MVQAWYDRDMNKVADWLRFCEHAADQKHHWTKADKDDIGSNTLRHSQLEEWRVCAACGHVEYVGKA